MQKFNNGKNIISVIDKPYIHVLYENNTFFIDFFDSLCYKSFPMFLENQVLGKDFSFFSNNEEKIGPEISIFHFTNWRRVFLHLDGNFFTCLVRVLDVDDVPGFCIFFQDILLKSDLLPYENKMEVIQDFSGGIAHDFNNIFSTVCILCERLLHNFASSHDIIHDKETKYVKNIYFYIKKLSHLTHTFSLLSSSFYSKTSIFSITSLLSSVLDIFSYLFSENEVIKLCSCTPPLLVNGSFDELSLCFAHILLNAIESSCSLPPSIELDNGLYDFLKKKHNLAYRSSLLSQCILVKITDFGNGISPTIRDKVFLPFFTTKDMNHNKGLGLSIAYTVVTRHGGIIDIDTSENGSIIYVILPQYSQPKLFLGDTTSQNTIHSDEEYDVVSENSQQKDILVIEDNIIFRDILSVFLKKKGYNIHCFSNGREGLDFFATAYSSINLILSDIIMPEMDGISFFKKVSSKLYKKNIIFMSGNPGSDCYHYLNEFQRAYFIQKPFGLKNLLDLVEKTIL